ncbi:MAG: plasmid maintenance system killer protein [Pseudomonadaceae bacterium]|nr:plasmid maintenance system killer protein [Pseudomonadaceae bacterium]
MIDTAQLLDDIDLQGFLLYPLKGEQSGVWSNSVSGTDVLPLNFGGYRAFKKLTQLREAYPSFLT